MTPVASKIAEMRHLVEQTSQNIKDYKSSIEAVDKFIDQLQDQDQIARYTGILGKINSDNDDKIINIKMELFESMNYLDAEKNAPKDNEFTADDRAALEELRTAITQLFPEHEPKESLVTSNLEEHPDASNEPPVSPDDRKAPSELVSMSEWEQDDDWEDESGDTPSAQQQGSPEWVPNWNWDLDGYAVSIESDPHAQNEDTRPVAGVAETPTPDAGNPSEDAERAQSREDMLASIMSKFRIATKETADHMDWLYGPEMAAERRHELDKYEALAFVTANEFLDAEEQSGQEALFL